MVSGFRNEVYEICALLGKYVAYSHNSILIFHPDTLVRIYHYTLRNIPEKRITQYFINLSDRIYCSLTNKCSFY